MKTQTIGTNVMTLRPFFGRPAIETIHSLSGATLTMTAAQTYGHKEVTMKPQATALNTQVLNPQTQTNSRTQTNRMNPLIRKLGSVAPKAALLAILVLVSLAASPMVFAKCSFSWGTTSQILASEGVLAWVGASGTLDGISPGSYGETILQGGGFNLGGLVPRYNGLPAPGSGLVNLPASPVSVGFNAWVPSSATSGQTATVTMIVYSAFGEQLCKTSFTVQVISPPTKGFISQWSNNGNGQIGGWSTNDRYISGKFESNGKAQLLGIGSAGAAEMMDFNGSSWGTAWHSTSGLPGWATTSTDKFVIGDFAGLGRDQVLAINDNSGKAQLMSYAAGSWTTLSSIVGGKIDWWYMNANDQYTAGDFDGDGVTELLATNSGTGYAHLMKFSGGTWHTIWTNLGNHWISGWYISAGDNYLSGNFDGQGPSGLLATATNGYAALVKYSGGQWYNVWDNQGSGKIHWWYMSPSDRYPVGNFDGQRDQLLAIAGNVWSHLMQYSGSDWDTPWGNNGNPAVGLWYIGSSDVYLTGDFNGDGRKDCFAIATNGSAQLIQYIP